MKMRTDCPSALVTSVKYLCVVDVPILSIL